MASGHVWNVALEFATAAAGGVAGNVLSFPSSPASPALTSGLGCNSALDYASPPAGQGNPEIVHTRCGLPPPKPFPPALLVGWSAADYASPPAGQLQPPKQFPADRPLLRGEVAS